MASHGLKFGFTLPQGWRGGDLPQSKEEDPVKQYQYSKKIAETADLLGFDSVYTYDHFVPHYKYDTENNFFECFTLLSSIASITKNLHVGQIVTCNSYRSPALLAKMLSTLDVITNGRVELGIGAGWYEEEYAAYGYNYPSDVVRIKQLDESISVIRAMWTDKKATFAGKYYSIKDAVCNPKPVQKPHPTIMVGGSGEKYLLRVAAKQADRYNHYFGTPDEMKRKLGILGDHCKAVGRDYNEIEKSIVLPCIVRERHEDIVSLVKKQDLRGQTVDQYIENMAGGFMIGTPDRIVKGLAKYMDAGVTHFIIHFIDNLDAGMLRLFDSKVIRKI